MRKKYPMLKDAYYQGVCHDNGVFVFDRFNDHERMRAVVNLSDKPYKVVLNEEDDAVFAESGQSVLGDTLVQPGNYSLLYFQE